MANDIAVSPPRKKKFGALNTLILPMSKAKVLVRRPSMFSLVKSGGLPGELTSLVWKLFGDSNGVSLASVLEEPGPEVEKFAILVEKFIPHVLVSVTVGDVTDAEEDEQGVTRGTIAMIDIPDIDKNHLFLYGVGVLKGLDEIGEVVAADLEAFRARAARTDGGPSGEEVRAEAQPTGGDSSGGPSSV